MRGLARCLCPEEKVTRKLIAVAKFHLPVEMLERLGVNVVMPVVRRLAGRSRSSFSATLHLGKCLPDLLLGEKTVNEKRIVGCSGMPTSHSPIKNDRGFSCRLLNWYMCANSMNNEYKVETRQMQFFIIMSRSCRSS